MRKLFFILAASAIFFGVVGTPFRPAGTTYSNVALAADQQQLNLFTTEDAAQKHCPADTVVWLNT